MKKNKTYYFKVTKYYAIEVEDKFLGRKKVDDMDEHRIEVDAYYKKETKLITNKNIKVLKTRVEIKG